MKKLLLTSEWKFHQQYQSWLNKYRVKKEFVTLIEIWMLVAACLFCTIAYLIFTNKSSTQGYFLRSARTDLNNTEFNYEIVKTEILDLDTQNRTKLEENNSSTLLSTNVETIKID